LTPQEQAELCLATEARILDQCETEGYRCSVSDSPVSARLYCDKQDFYCNYRNISTPCPIGHYCPTSSEQIPCDRGYFCPLASTRQVPCPFSELSCPYSEMDYPDGSLIFLVYVIVFTIGLLIQKYFVQKMLSRNERSLSDRTDEESHTLNHGMVNINTLKYEIPLTLHFYACAPEQESEQYKKTLLAMSEQISDKPTMKMAAVRTIRMIQMKTIRGTIAADRARKNWKKLIKSRAFKQHVQLMKDRARSLVNHMTGSFVFQPVKNPLTISFDHLHLDLKANGKPILRDIFGCFRPFNVTALMGSSGAGKVCLLYRSKRPYVCSVDGTLYFKCHLS
jgi:hypothetical protein